MRDYSNHQSSDPLIKKSLFCELKVMADKGVTLLMDGRRSSPGFIAQKASLSNRYYSYMRDYVFIGGVLKELRFDKVRNP
jgi:hypothetical protein